jgi:hypothetical protein
LPASIPALWSMLAIVGMLGLLAASALSTASAPARHAEPPNRFVGNAACALCHPTECRQQGASRHAVTLHLPDRQDLGGKMPPAGRVPGTDIVLVENGGHMGITLAGMKGKPMSVNLTFGSGKTGMTNVVIVGPQLFELHKSYFPSLRRWYLTPGHEHQKPTDVGMMYKPDIARQCVGCHAVTVPSNGLIPERQFFGVRCEACHGPGGAHVDAMRAGNMTDIHMAKLERLNATDLNNLCARCHRGRENVDMKTSQAQATNRFQPYGLMKSRCFLESGNRLSCLTCHSPHTDAATNPKTYETVCISCHTSAPHRAARPAGAKPAKVCPVNRVSGCVRCHMPSRKIFSDSQVPTTMADHWIRVYRKGG